jgi:hypothetical protein
MVESLVDHGLSDASRANQYREAAGRRTRARRARQPAVALCCRSEWFGAAVDEAKLAGMGIKPERGGPHQSETVMLAELTALLSAGAAERAAPAVLQKMAPGRPPAREGVPGVGPAIHGPAGQARA